MKKLFFFFAFVLCATFANAQGVITFKNGETTHDFGKVEEGAIASYTFEFKNTGQSPVVISSAQPSCGCTTPDWTKEPVLPGKSGKVTAAYNSAGRVGTFSKTITVISNSESPSITLTIKGEVVAKPAKKTTE